ncbi:CUB domain protein, partial [Teladorsagia circumcincta]
MAQMPKVKDTRGDIILFPEQAKQIYENALKTGQRRVKRKFIGSDLRRWDPTRPIVYSFDGSHRHRVLSMYDINLCGAAGTDAGHGTFRHATRIPGAAYHRARVGALAQHHMPQLCSQRQRQQWKSHRERLRLAIPSQTLFLVFTDVDGCASNVGRHPLGEEQLVSLAPECIRLGVIAHEVAHALGFWHEQSRPDRDQFVNVRWENIDKDSKGQFLKEDPDDVDNAGVPYDYGSIMHYRSKAFSRYDDLYTISTFVTDYQKTIAPTYTSVLPLKTYIFQVNGGWTKFSSPGYPREFKEGQECSWLLVAPHGQVVEMQFIGEFEMYCKVRHSLCMDYVEVRNSTDFANTGMRYCCYGTPSTSIRSATTDLVVLFRSFYRGGRGFEARARALPAN